MISWQRYSDFCTAITSLRYEVTLGVCVITLIFKLNCIFGHDTEYLTLFRKERSLDQLIRFKSHA